jgi:hypothetical protein
MEPSRDQRLIGTITEALTPVLKEVLESLISEHYSERQMDSIVAATVDGLSKQLTVHERYQETCREGDLLRADGSLNAEGVVAAIESAAGQLGTGSGAAMQMTHLASNARNTFGNLKLFSRRQHGRQ